MYRFNPSPPAKSVACCVVFLFLGHPYRWYSYCVSLLYVRNSFHSPVLPTWHMYRTVANANLLLPSPNSVPSKRHSQKPSESADNAPECLSGLNSIPEEHSLVTHRNISLDRADAAGYNWLRGQDFVLPPLIRPVRTQLSTSASARSSSCKASYATIDA